MEKPEKKKEKTKYTNNKKDQELEKGNLDISIWFGKAWDTIYLLKKHVVQ